ncbi:MAG: T9SS type A sorting domain-containing protein [Spirosomataceae bacterium]
MPSGASVTAYLWTVTGGTVTPTSSTQYTAYVTFPNTLNSGATVKKIKVKITYVVPPSTTPVEVTSSEEIIEVKHIGAISSLTIAGSTYSNNNTHLHPCNTTAITVSIPNVVTDPPQGVTYYWDYPSGWSGPATTTYPTNSVTVTPGLNQQGQIEVQARRSDGGVTVSIKVNITRPLPVISSVSNNDFLLCSGGSQSVSASGSNADSFVWTPSSNVTVNGNSSPQNTSSAVSIAATGQGTFTVQAYSSSCGVTSSNSIVGNVRYGPPVISYPNQWLFDAGSNMWQCSNSITPFSGISCTWTLVSGSASLIPNNNDCYVTTTGGATVSITATNTCGTSDATYYDIPAAEGYRMMAYPNPTKNVLTLELKSEDVSSIDIYSQSSAERVKSVPVKDFVKDNASKEGPKVDVNVGDLPRGIYYLHINPKGDSKQKVQIVQVRLE